MNWGGIPYEWTGQKYFGGGYSKRQIHHDLLAVRTVPLASGGRQHLYQVVPERRESACDPSILAAN